MQRSVIVTILQKIERAADRMFLQIDICQGRNRGYVDAEANAAMADLKAAAQRFLYFTKHSTHSLHDVPRVSRVGDMWNWEASDADETNYDRELDAEIAELLERRGDSDGMPTDRDVRLAEHHLCEERADIDARKRAARRLARQSGDVIVEFPAPAHSK